MIGADAKEVFITGMGRNAGPVEMAVYTPLLQKLEPG